MSIDRKAIKARSETAIRQGRSTKPGLPPIEIPKMPQIADEPSHWANYPGDCTHMGGEMFAVDPNSFYPQWGVLTTEYDAERDVTRVGFGRIS